jgi:hypothetical protein|tara:strand:- start:850 stop:1032 length:183 start_codon:yes stop_codon:yes gene_type:complete
MLKPIPKRYLNSYTIFLARYLGLFLGLPMLFGVVLKPALILIIVIGLDYLWHKIKDLDIE